MPSVSDLKVDSYCLSDAGREPSKQVNEDTGRAALTKFGQLALVCDGMGGHSGGQAASQAAVNTIIARLESSGPAAPGQAVMQAIQAANSTVYEQGGGTVVTARPGSTCVAVLVHAHGAEIAHVGDSRVYLIRAGQICRMTRDHSVVQQLVDAGMITQEQALEHPDSNRITRALGMAPEVEVELYPGPFKLANGDMFLLASDGLTDLVSDDEILSLISRRSPEGLESACRALVDTANLRGGHDNITVLVLKILCVPETAKSQRDPQSGGPLPFSGPKTLLDTAASPTQVDAESPVTQPGVAPPTLVSNDLDESKKPPEPVPPILERGRNTQPRADRAAGFVSPTRTDTEPGLQESPFHQSLPTTDRGFTSDYPDRISKLGRNAKPLLVVAAVSTVVIVGAIALWWIVAALSRAPSDVSPPAPSPRATSESP